MEIRQFGPFKSLFDGVYPSYSGYLPLLGLRPGDATQSAIDRVEHALHAGESQLWLDAMLAERNWRPHLPAAVALLLDRSQTLSPVSLWSAIDRGSWVAPQLVVAALFSDAEFPGKLAKRLDHFGADRLTTEPAQTSAGTSRRLPPVCSLRPATVPTSPTLSLVGRCRLNMSERKN